MLIVSGLLFLMWLTKGVHGIAYSVSGMLAVTVLVLSGVLEWEDIHQNLKWGTAFFIFGSSISLILLIVIPMAQLEGVNPTNLALCLNMAPLSPSCW